MASFEINISQAVNLFFRENDKQLSTLKLANTFLENFSGIINFFNSEEELLTIKSIIEIQNNKVEEPNRRAYGDFQTNSELSLNIVQTIHESSFSPEFILEPTCGKGIFLCHALTTFSNVKRLIGIEIYYPYVLETKFQILELFITNKALSKPKIEIIHADIFGFHFQQLSEETKQLKTLIIGNPPWVTNSELTTLHSKNLPKKSNFKKVNGIDAITGKGNFDIGEYISIHLLTTFQNHNGLFAFLVKSTVVKNILVEQRKQQFSINQIEKLNIDAKKEFNVSVNACLFKAKLNQKTALACIERDFYTNKEATHFGWQDEKFVYSIKKYQFSKQIDGKSSLTWRQGLKHDCSKVMELKRENGHFINGLKEEIELEEDLVFALLKSSDLKKDIVEQARKITIVTQRKVGQDTSFIKRDYPKTFSYLNLHKSYFEKRKSIIYKGKPPFSIFGIGDYSFAKYKIAIAGMYKKTTFTLVVPQKNKPVMLDDTCYFIGFGEKKDAIICQKLLNSQLVQDFLASIIFPDSKRSITKEILMRIDLNKIANFYLNDETWLLQQNISKNDLALFINEFLKSKHSEQMQLF